jgi:hypothetical protein
MNTQVKLCLQKNERNGTFRVVVQGVEDADCSDALKYISVAYIFEHKPQFIKKLSHPFVVEINPEQIPLKQIVVELYEISSEQGFPKRVDFSLVGPFDSWHYVRLDWEGSNRYINNTMPSECTSEELFQAIQTKATEFAKSQIESIAAELFHVVKPDNCNISSSGM